MDFEQALDRGLIKPTSSPKRYDFQVNLHFTDRQVSACGMGPEECLVVFTRSLSGIPKAIQKKTGLRLEQIVLSFQPE
jgi:hypothetical protein